MNASKNVLVLINLNLMINVIQNVLQEQYIISLKLVVLMKFHQDII